MSKTVTATAREGKYKPGDTIELCSAKDTGMGIVALGKVISISAAVGGIVTLVVKIIVGG